MKGVPFDHKSHQTKSKTCRGCHHETLNACRECHDLIGNPDGAVSILPALTMIFLLKKAVSDVMVLNKQKRIVMDVTMQYCR